MQEQEHHEREKRGSVGGWRRRSKHRRALAAKRPQARQQAAVPIVEAEGGFRLEVRAVGGATWTLHGNSKDHLVAEMKERLVSEDARFRTHRADLVFGSRVLEDGETLGDCGVKDGIRLVAVFTDLRAAVLIIGGGTAGRAVAKEVSQLFQDRWVILVDPREYFEHPCGILRAYVDPHRWESLVVPFEDAVRPYPNVQFIQGEVLRLRPGSATVASARDGTEFSVRFEFCVVAAGCSFAAGASGETLWNPSCLDAVRKHSEWSNFDERTLTGRRRHIREEHRKLQRLEAKAGTVLVVGADYQGVEWACDLKHFFPGLQITLVDSLPRCLATLPESAAEYAERHLSARGIRTFYSVTYDAKNAVFWSRIGLQRRADVTYILTGHSAHSAFMPTATLSSRGPGGGGWIVTNKRLQVCQRNAKDQPVGLFGNGRIFAAGDCHYGAVASVPASSTAGQPGSVGLDKAPPMFSIAPVPKTALAAVSWAAVVCRNIACMVNGWPLQQADWPPQAGIVVVSLGPEDGVVAWKVKWTRDSGEAILFGGPAVEMKRRLTWPAEHEAFLGDPTRWLETFQRGIPAGHLLTERGRALLRLSRRAW